MVIHLARDHLYTCQHITFVTTWPANPVRYHSY